jgi:hypothetical protein
MEELLSRIYDRSGTWISDVVLGGTERVLRACITSYRSEVTDIDRLMEELEHALTTQTNRGRKDAT